MREQVGGQARAGVTGVRRLRGQQKARLLEFRRDGGELRHGGTDDVADRIVTKNSVASPGTADGVITPPVQNLSAKTAGRVWSQIGMRRRRRRAVRKRGEGM